MSRELGREFLEFRNPDRELAEIGGVAVAHAALPIGDHRADLVVGFDQPVGVLAAVFRSLDM